jgi:hypothetical protein
MDEMIKSINNCSKMVLSTFLFSFSLNTYGVAGTCIPMGKMNATQIQEDSVYTCNSPQVLELLEIQNKVPIEKVSDHILEDCVKNFRSTAPFSLFNCGGKPVGEEPVGEEPVGEEPAGKKKVRPFCANPDYDKAVVRALHKYGQCYGMNENEKRMAFCLMGHESKFHPNAQSASGPIGLGQLSNDSHKGILDKSKGCLPQVGAITDEIRACPPDQPDLGVGVTMAMLRGSSDMILSDLIQPTSEELKGSRAYEIDAECMKNLYKKRTGGRTNQVEYLFFDANPKLSLVPDLVMASHNTGRNGIKLAFRKMLLEDCKKLLEQKITNTKEKAAFIEQARKRLSMFMARCANMPDYNDCAKTDLDHWEPGYVIEKKGTKEEEEKAEALRKRQKELFEYVGKIRSECAKDSGNPQCGL